MGYKRVRSKTCVLVEGSLRKGERKETVKSGRRKMREKRGRCEKFAHIELHKICIFNMEIN